MTCVDEEEIPEVVIGATRRELRLTFTDEKNVAIPITGGAVRLQGQSDTLTGLDIDVAGTIFNGAGGVARWTGLGGTSYVTLTALGNKKEAVFNLRGKFTDAGGNADWTPYFKLKWVRPPV